MGDMTAVPKTYAPSQNLLLANHLAKLSYQSLVAEAELTPKPGLVDRRGSGVHLDLSLDTMRRSASAIAPYFTAMAAVAAGAPIDRALRVEVAAVGRQAEDAMLQATNGSNAHKGAIWVLGLLVTAVATGRSLRPATIAKDASLLAQLPDLGRLQLVSHGDLVQSRYGAKGARGEADAAFPHVVKVGLPALRAARKRRVSETNSRLSSLLAIMASLEDTCVLYRGGHEGLQAVRTGRERGSRFRRTGNLPAEDMMLGHLDHALTARNISAGRKRRSARCHSVPGRSRASSVMTWRATTVTWRGHMEQLEFDYPAANRRIIKRAHVGVVGSGDMEVLMQPADGIGAHVSISTSVRGFQSSWKAVFDRFFSKFDGAVNIQINDAGATPGSVLLPPGTGSGGH